MSVFTPEIISAITSHMNGDHPEDNLLIVQAFVNPEATFAQMTGLDSAGGIWLATIDGQEQEVTIAWATPIQTRAEIRREVVVLYDKACKILGVEPRPHD